MEFMEALNELAAKIGIGRIVPDGTGSVTLLFDGKTEVSFTPDADESVVYLQSEISVVYLQSEIADASSLGDGDCRSLMEASLSDTDGAAFAIGRETGKLILWKRFGEFPSCAALETAINEFLGQIARWQERLDGGLAGGAADDSASQNAGTFNFIQI